MSRPNVIVIVLDTLRADRVSGFGYDRQTTPHFDAFLEDATVFTDAVTQSPWSIPSHASLFTGQYPHEHGATTITPILQERRYLPKLLAEAGYETYGISFNEYVRPLTGFGSGFDEFVSRSSTVEPAWCADALARVVNWGMSTPRVRRPVERAFTAIRTAASPVRGDEASECHSVVAHVADALARAQSPYFLFVNLMDAHLPRSPAPEYYDQFVDDDLEDVAVVANERTHTFGEQMDGEALRKMSQLYDADVRTMDVTFGEVIGTLSRAGALDDSLVVCVSDHGEHLGEFGLVGHQYSVFDAVTSVPLAVQFPGGGPDRVDAQVELRRVFHTVLDETGLESFPDRSLSSGVGDAVARGEFFTPMLDLERLYRHGEPVYEPDLAGETLSFRRTDGSKRVRFGGKEWQFDVPEHDHHSFETQSPGRV